MKIFQTFKLISEKIREDISLEDYKMSKSEFYQIHSPKTYDNTISYIVQYRGVDTVTSWGPFTSIESANDWSNKILENYLVECDVIYIHNLKSDPDTWFI